MIQYNKDKSIGTNIGRVLRALRTTLQRKFEESGYPLTLEQWLILMLLKMKDGQQQNELSHSCVKEKTTMTRIIDGLEKRQLIVRVQDKTDRRSNLIFLTDAGKEAEKKLTPIGIEVNRLALIGFEENEIDMLNNMLKRVYENLLKEQIDNIENNV